MKKIILLFAAGLTLVTTYAQSTWDWVNRPGPQGLCDDRGLAICMDVSGIYVTGRMGCGNVFGSTTLNPLPACSTPELFIVKYDNAGTPTPLWGISPAGGGSVGNGICSDGSNVYVTGSFSCATITFGTTTLNRVGSGDIFVAKFDAATGNSLWAKSYGGTGDDYGKSISTDGTNVWVTGDFRSPTIAFGATTLTNKGGSFTPPDMFVAQFDASGNLNWITSSAGTNQDNGLGISNDASGNAYISGWYQTAPVIFGATTFSNFNRPYTAKYNSAGNVQWAVEGEVSGVSTPTISTDAAGNSYIASSFASATLTFGSTTLTNAGGGGTSDIVVFKYNNAGVLQWAKSWGGTASEAAQGISTNAAGTTVYITGNLHSPSVTFGSFTLSGNNATYGSVFIAKLDGATGNALCAANAPGNASGAADYGAGVGTYDGSSASVTGQLWSSSVTFGSILNTASSSSDDIFTAHFDGSSCAVLPIGLISFTGRHEGSENILEWTTASEKNSDYFKIERSRSSSGSGQWQVLGKVKGAGTSNANNNYQFIDPSPLSGGNNGVSYYRLRQTDYNGKITYSQTVSITTNTEQRPINIYPNPANTVLNCEMFSKEEGMINVQVIDVLGNVVMKEETKSDRGLNTRQLNINALSAGMYFLKITNGTEQTQVKFAKQ